MRQIGRTTRMLREAVSLALQGKQVLVLAANRGEVSRLASDLTRETRRLGYLDSTVAELRQRIRVDIPSHDFDWTNLQERPFSMDREVLVDHYAIESWLSRALEMLHRYDPQPAVAPPPQPMCRPVGITDDAWAGLLEAIARVVRK